MKKLLLLIPVLLTSCISSEDQARNAQWMQGVYNNQQAAQDQQNRAYQQNLENEQRQQMIELQRKQLQQQSQPQSYSVTDQNGNMKTYTIKKEQYGLGSPTGK